MPCPDFSILATKSNFKKKTEEFIIIGVKVEFLKRSEDREVRSRGKNGPVKRISGKMKNDAHTQGKAPVKNGQNLEQAAHKKRISKWPGNI